MTVHNLNVNNVHLMNTKKKSPNDQEHLNILIEIDKKSDVTQREMAKFLGISLGKLNFCILELKKRIN